MSCLRNAFFWQFRTIRPTPAKEASAYRTLPMRISSACPVPAVSARSVTATACRRDLSHIIYESDSPDTVKNLIASGLGVGSGRTIRGAWTAWSRFACCLLRNLPASVPLSYSCTATPEGRRQCAALRLSEPLSAAAESRGTALRTCLHKRIRVFSANFAAYCVKNTCRATARLRIFPLSATKLCSKIHIFSCEDRF